MVGGVSGPKDDVLVLTSDGVSWRSSGVRSADSWVMSGEYPVSSGVPCVDLAYPVGGRKPKYELSLLTVWAVDSSMSHGDAGERATVGHLARETCPSIFLRGIERYMEDMLKDKNKNVKKKSFGSREPVRKEPTWAAHLPADWSYIRKMLSIEDQPNDRSKGGERSANWSTPRHGVLRPPRSSQSLSSQHTKGLIFLLLSHPTHDTLEEELVGLSSSMVCAEVNGPRLTGHLGDTTPSRVLVCASVFHSLDGPCRLPACLPRDRPCAYAKSKVKTNQGARQPLPRAAGRFRASCQPAEIVALPIDCMRRCPREDDGKSKVGLEGL